MYAERAVAIFDLSRSLRHRMEVTSAVGTFADKMAVIDVGVEAVNKIFHFFVFGEDLVDSIEANINALYRTLQPTPSHVNRLFYRLMAMIRQVETRAVAWVQRCRK